MQAPYESVKEEIREQLFNELLKQEFEDWISNIRENTYIRISL